MLFPDYEATKVVYHVAPVTDLKEILKNGLQYDDKTTYKSKYLNFHRYIDRMKPSRVPPWVIRERAIFSSLNFKKDHSWHAHSVLLGIKIKPERCWVADESLANEIYEPFILRDVPGFEQAKDFLIKIGEKNVGHYWETSLSFEENLKMRKDLQDNYDAEVMIFHEIKPEAIQPIAIISDHRFMEISEWKRLFKC